MRFNDKDKKEEVKESEDNSPEEAAKLFPAPPDIRTVALIGEINEERTTDVLIGLIMLAEEAKSKGEKPIDFYISTYGGSADEMFSIYDMMKHTKKTCEIHTIGLGKVMSGGTLVLAAGTKGKRRIGKHCRVMIHNVAAGSYGELHNMENELKAIQQVQDLYVKAMVKETKFTRRELHKLLERKVNVYLTAKEAIDYGIADEIF